MKCLLVIFALLLSACASAPTATPAPMSADVKPMRAVIVREPEPTPLPTCKIATGIAKGNVNLRAEPNGTIIGALPEGATVTLLQEGGYWHMVKAGDVVGWVYATLCKISEVTK